MKRARLAEISRCVDPRRRRPVKDRHAYRHIVLEGPELLESLSMLASRLGKTRPLEHCLPRIRIYTKMMENLNPLAQRRRYNRLSGKKPRSTHVIHGYFDPTGIGLRPCGKRGRRGTDGKPSPYPIQGTHRSFAGKKGLVPLDIEHDFGPGELRLEENLGDPLRTRTMRGARENPLHTEGLDGPDHPVVVGRHYDLAAQTETHSPSRHGADQRFAGNGAEGFFRNSERAEAGWNDYKEVHSQS